MLDHVAFGVLAAAATGMLVLSVLLWHGHLVEEPTEPTLPAAAGPNTAPAAGAATLIAREPQQARVVLTAARGPCWLSIRRDSATGKRLYLGILRRGRSLRLSGRRIWMQVGAGENIVAQLNGRRIGDFPEGVAEVTVTAEGLARI
jgi:hypothetical protein